MNKKTLSLSFSFNSTEDMTSTVELELAAVAEVVGFQKPWDMINML